MFYSAGSHMNYYQSLLLSVIPYLMIGHNFDAKING